MSLDPRIVALSPWQRIVYDLCWSVGVSSDTAVIQAKGAELDRMKAERPEEYEKAFRVWEQIMYEVLY